MRLIAQFGDAFFGGVEAEKRDIGRFALHGILAGGLAEAVRRTFNVEHVIDDLKTQPDSRRIATERFVLRLIERPTASRSQAHRSMDQRPRFECVHALEFIQAQCIAHVRKIEGLPACHAVRACCFREHRNLRLRLGQRCFGQYLKSKGLQRVSSQKRHCFPVGDVTGGLASPQDVVVHARQVVVDQRIGVDELHGDGGVIDKTGVGAPKLS